MSQVYFVFVFVCCLGGASSSWGGAAQGVELEDVTLHRCVALSKFDADRTITFVPPDGEL